MGCVTTTLCRPGQTRRGGEEECLHARLTVSFIIIKTKTGLLTEGDHNITTVIMHKSLSLLASDGSMQINKRFPHLGPAEMTLTSDRREERRIEESLAEQLCF